MHKKYKILIVEDEPIIATDIEMTLEKLGYQVTDTVEDAAMAIESIKNNKPDLILLDINIEGETDGVMLAQDINTNYQIPFIYLTSNTDSFTINRVKRTNPAGFIVKPFTEKDLLSNIEIGLFKSIEPIKEKPKLATDIFVKEGSNLIKIQTKDLLFIKADDSYSKLFTKDKIYVISVNLGKLFAKLPSDSFIRIHRSYIININFIDKITNGYIILSKHKIPVSKSYQEAFFNRINKI